MKTNPYILLSPRLFEIPEYGETRLALDLEWGKFVKSLGATAIPLMDDGDPSPYFDLPGLRGLILTGGNDLNSLNPSDLSRRRDSFELKLLKMARAKSLPIVGVCRGAQLLAEEAGFSFRECEGHIATRHKVLMQEPVGDSRFLPEDFNSEVNSFHRFGVIGVSDSADVLALDESDGVEAFWDEGRASLGIMWHPEREVPFRDCDLRLFKNIFDLQDRKNK